MTSYARNLLNRYPKKKNRFITYASFIIIFLPNMAPFVALAFWTNKLYTFLSDSQFQWNQKIYITIFTMIHIYYRILSPLHQGYTTISSKNNFL